MYFGGSRREKCGESGDTPKVCYIFVGRTKLKEMEQAFEDYWKTASCLTHQGGATALGEERRMLKKMNTPGDWILLVVPFAVMVWVPGWALQRPGTQPVLAIVLGVVAAVLGELVKPYITGKRSYADVDADIKQHFYELYQKKGLAELDRVRVSSA
jgi:hypothetical protein